VDEDTGPAVESKEGMGRRSRAAKKKMTAGPSFEIKQIKDAVEKMDVLEELATEMIKRMG